MKKAAQAHGNGLAGRQVRRCPLKCFFSNMIGIVGIVSVGCSTPSLFPPEAIRDTAPLQFGVLEAKPDVFKGRVVQLAGRIVGIERSAEGILIRAQELPLARNPGSGPVELVKGTPEFAIIYPGKVDEKALWFWNKFVVVGLAQGSHTIHVDGVSHTAPYVVARCIHIWKTGSYRIEDYPHLTDGYYPLEHQTYCAN